MKKRRIIAPTVTEPAPRLWSNCLAVGDALYISGLTSRQSDQLTIAGKCEYEQARIIFSKMTAYLEAAGGTIDDIVQMVIYVTNMSKNTEVWRARDEFFQGDFPTCTLVEVSKLANAAILVEISATASLGCSAARQ